MKSLIATCVLLVLMLSGIAANAVYINKVVMCMEERIEQLPDGAGPESAEAVGTLEEDWKQSVFWVCLTVSYPIADRIGEQLALLRAAAECGDLYGYRAAKATLSDAIEDMHRLEKLPFFK